MDMIQQVMEKVNGVFDAHTLERLARETGLIRRKRKFDAKIFLETLILLRLESSRSSLEDLAHEFEQYDRVMTKQALHKKFNRTAVNFVRQVVLHLLENGLSEQTITLSDLPFIKKVCVVDSSEIRLHKSLNTLFPQTRNQGAAVKLQSLMDGLSNQLLAREICPSNEPDQGYKNHLQLVQTGDLLIGDLGYFCVDSFKKIQGNGGFFLSRYFKKTHLYENDSQELLELRSLLENSSRETIELPVLLGVSRFPCRLVGVKLTEEAYQKRLKTLTEKHRKDPRLKPNQEDLLDRWTLLVTNLPLSVAARNLLELYRLRWQIELLFKMMKTFLNLRKIEETNPERALISIYISLVAMVLLSYVSMTIVDREISLYKASKIFSKNIRKFFDLMNKKRKCAIIWLRERLMKHALKESRQTRPSTKLSLGVNYA